MIDVTDMQLRCTFVFSSFEHLWRVLEKYVAKKFFVIQNIPMVRINALQE
jgi:hypothetical protein